MKEWWYFTITGGPVADAITRFKDKVREEVLARKLFIKKWKADGTYGNSRGVESLIFEKGKPPANWIKGSAYNSWKPRGISKEGKAIRAEMATLKQSGAQILQQEILGKHDTMFMGGAQDHFAVSIRYICYEQYGDVEVLMVPKLQADVNSKTWKPPKGWKIPEGMEVLLTSQYHALREAHLEKTGKAEADPLLIV